MWRIIKKYHYVVLPGLLIFLVMALITKWLFVFLLIAAGVYAMSKFK